jgi:hypothetical protein
MAKKNSYEKKAQKKQLLAGVASEDAKGSIKNSALETGRDVLVGAIGGGLAGAILGRSSFLVGVAVTGVGHYMGSNGTAAFGVGMMASGGYQAVAGTMSGTDKKGLAGVKERMAAFKEEFKRKLFLDKIIKSKKANGEDSTGQRMEGMGDVQYFTYPNARELQGSDTPLDMSALDRIEKQVADSAEKFAAKQSLSQGLNNTSQYASADISELNF